ncbi:hypothetical protein UCD39_13725 [Nitrospirillum sp. BR 11752]|uniref:hypothetical protein n=1 Tax=Nitrospirillum sp. BR 11752 TaxID=3104293 RepID=UPI002EC17CC2|nr:hypothetical protein [Nitrospirillum sp. BR 11752]
MATVTSSERIFVFDEKNTLRIWLEEKVVGHELSMSEADNLLREYENQGKLWTGPFKDSFGSAKLIYKLANDVKSWKGARVLFMHGKNGDLVVIKGWPEGRRILTGTR